MQNMPIEYLPSQQHVAEQSVINRRGGSVKNLNLTKSNAAEMQEICTPKIIDDLLEFVVTPKSADKTTEVFNFSSCCYQERDTQNILSPRSNPCALLTPLTLKNTNFIDYLRDITTEGDEENSNEMKTSDQILSSIINSNSSTKVTLFTPTSSNNLFSLNFFENANLNEKEIELVAPKSKELISSSTPVVLRRNSEAGDRFNIFLPPEHTADLVNTFQERNNELSVFTFPSNGNNGRESWDNWHESFHPNSHMEINEIKRSLKRSLNTPPSKLTFSNIVPQKGRPRGKRTLKGINLPPGMKLKDFHNKLERQRREEQFIRFQKLKFCIPGLINKKKCSKISILKAATSYINDLHRDDIILQQAKLEEESLKNSLLQKFHMMAKYSHCF